MGPAWSSHEASNGKDHHRRRAGREGPPARDAPWLRLYAGEDATVQIPVQERDPQLSDKLKAEYPAILRWMLDGCLEWQQMGLAPAKIVTEATDEYFDDQDLHKQWLEECTEADTAAAFVKTSQLYASWEQWCEERGLTAGSARGLQEALVDRGLQRQRTKTGRGFTGIRLKAPADVYDVIR